MTKIWRMGVARSTSLISLLDSCQYCYRFIVVFSAQDASLRKMQHRRSYGDFLTILARPLHSSSLENQGVNTANAGRNAASSLAYFSIVIAHKSFEKSQQSNQRANQDKQLRSERTIKHLVVEHVSLLQLRKTVTVS